MDKKTPPTYVDGNGKVHYADKFSYEGAQLFLTAHVLICEGSVINLDRITYCGCYSRWYAGNGETSITDRYMKVVDGKKTVVDHSYSKTAGPSWDDYADVMESDDCEEIEIVAGGVSYKFEGPECDWNIWFWLCDYFPDEEENKEQ